MQFEQLGPRLWGRRKKSPKPEYHGHRLVRVTTYTVVEPGEDGLGDAVFEALVRGQAVERGGLLRVTVTTYVLLPPAQRPQQLPPEVTEALARGEVLELREDTHVRALAGIAPPGEETRELVDRYGWGDQL